MIYQSFPLLLFFSSLLAKSDASLLFQAEKITEHYFPKFTKIAPPSSLAQTDSCLETASIWFSIDLEQVKSPAFETLQKEQLWEHLREIGVEGVYFKGLKKGKEARTAICIDPSWGNGWEEISFYLQKKGIALIGDSLSKKTGINKDFQLALQNVGNYPGLYHLIEIEKKDWKLLPPIKDPRCFSNISWLSIQTLHQKGYVPEQFSPYGKKSNWNATAEIKGEDGKVRRWIYLKDGQIDPVIDWLNPSFGGCRIASADTLDSIYRLGQKICYLDASMEKGAQEMLILWIRKLGGYSVLKPQGGLKELKSSKTDLICDTFTRKALLHALLTEDTEILKIFYSLFLNEGIAIKKMVHLLQPFDRYHCDWSSFLSSFKKELHYDDELLTQEALNLRLLKTDLFKLKEEQGATWTSYCMQSLGIKEFEAHRQEAIKAHLLLAFFYAMQPGVFSFSASDLLGLSVQTPLDFEPNEFNLYGSIFSQMKNSCSFAMQLKKILRLRKESGIQTAELIAVLPTQKKGCLFLLHRLPDNHTLQLLAVNFAKTKAHETLERGDFKHTSAIDLFTGLAEKKPFASPFLSLELPPFSGKVILFQPKYDETL